MSSSISQTETISHVVSSLPGTIFTTNPSKTVSPDSFTSYISSSIPNNVKLFKLIESNDPLDLIYDYISSERDESFSLTVTTNSNIVLSSLPVLKKFSNFPIVFHVELIDSNYQVLTSLKDLNNFIILNTLNSIDSHDISIASYAIAKVLNKPVIHFFNPNSDTSSNNKFDLSPKPSVLNITHQIIDSFSSSGKENEQQETSENKDLENPALKKNDSIVIYTAFQILKKKFNRSYSFFESSASINSATTDIFLILGSLYSALSNNFNKLIVPVFIRVYRPWSVDDLKKILSSSFNNSLNLSLITQSQWQAFSNYSPLLLDLFSNIESFNPTDFFKKIVSYNLKSIKNDKNSTNEFVSQVISNNNLPKPVQNLSLGSSSSTASNKNQLSNLAVAEKVTSLENLTYVKLLKQVFSDSLEVINSFNLAEVGSISTPEFGYGKFLRNEENRKVLINLIQSIVHSDSSANNSIKVDFDSSTKQELIQLLTRWLILSITKVRKFDFWSEINDISRKVIALLNKDIFSSTATKILEYKHYFFFNYQWIIGSDLWAYDIGSSGLHNVLKSDKNINLMIIDNTPFSSKKEQVECLTQKKKDIGLYAMNYGGCYVASIAIYASYTQSLESLIEAANFQGPSIVLAYLPFENENVNTLDILKETKRAVDAGYWPLYHFDSSAIDDDQQFQLDSPKIKKDLEDFLDRNNKLTLLAKRNPVFKRSIAQNSLGENVGYALKDSTKNAFGDLLKGLSGPNLTIAFASDGGNAESLARRLNNRATGRNFGSKVISMDEISVDELISYENLILISSTSGQGEFPQNGKAFWDQLKGSSNLDLNGLNFSVFGLGDSEYWPRKEDKKYYNKPAKDMYGKLKLFGANEIAPLGLGDDQDADGYQTGYNLWEPIIWEFFGVTNAGNYQEAAPITNEDMKLASDFLRGTIVEGLNDESTGAISATDQQLTKFHGIYMQDDRDIREQRKAEGLEPAYAFMIRARLPGGTSTPEQWLKIDELSDSRGNGTFKITTRATFQLHGVVKHDLKPAIRGINSTLMDTLGACGDVNRNVMVSALPENQKVHKQIAETGTIISEHLLPQTTAYHEIWLEGADESDKVNKPEVWQNRKDGPKKKKVMVAGNALVDQEPFYGNNSLYLPRKFKVSICVPPYNDVDVYSNDVGLIAIVDSKSNVLGYNVLVGGGMGTTHNNKKTYPRTGSSFGFVDYDDIKVVVEKIMLIQRDFGDRKNRKHARLKYTIDDMGVDVYKSKVEELWGKKFQKEREFKIESNIDHFGWTKDETGLNHYTCFIENGRVEDTVELPQKTGLKKIAKYLLTASSGSFRLTGNQHIIISNILDRDVSRVEKLMKKYKLDNSNFSGLRISSAACVAFPTCGLAMAESERYLPVIITKLEEALEEYGLRHDSIVMRMTGCPNGCSRPWLAEIALVGKAYDTYNLLLGGGYHGQRLNKLYRSNVKEKEILKILKPLFKRWSLERHQGEHFGDFLIRAKVIMPTTEGKYFHDDVPAEP
ncbi:sulfite reductase (NADPH) subunit beta ASCRUDRAFT_69698 [Ascoidea rubescens DSM 1968]|uniref:assimilatory sulfite reductase (NADPH) n=1 Tax=Ascoidea rubescens DSM 1968 TaxID=1344418 RepID=A0A1D2VK45_9ASCO|nr:hypothetical protein ASCRUDRAFT_69698 [Ascoidea rubescens DSM 1968]ODV61992.1 hypothetical protein ASCRUDRAFT_69698 [Ascoidea rubescens DSM 1968]